MGSPTAGCAEVPPDCWLHSIVIGNENEGSTYNLALLDSKKTLHWSHARPCGRLLGCEGT